MNSLPKVSVVIPAYNAAATIEKTLDSILAQTIAVGEIIVVDDGSSDATCEIVARYGDQVRVISQANAGPAAARNHGIRESQFDWIALLDADDTWLPEKLAHQLPHCQTGTGLIYCFEFEEEVKISGENLDFNTLWLHNYIGTSTVILNKKTLEKTGGFVEDREFIGAEDYNLWLRIAASEDRIVTVEKSLIHYTPAEGNLSSQYDQVIKAELLNVDVIAEQFNLSKEMVRSKKVALLEEYGLALFWTRNLPLARKCYGQLLKQRPTLKGLGYWLATFLPSSLLDAKRPATA